MARLFTEGFEMGDKLVLPNLTSAGSIRTDIKRTGSYGFAGRQNVAEWKHDVSLNEIYIRFGYYADNWYSSTNPSFISFGSTYVRFMVGATTLAHFNIGYTDASGNWYASVNNSIVATSSMSISSDNWYLIEMHFKLADSGGIMELKINGVTTISYTGDTKPTADTEFDGIKFYLGGAYSGAYQYIDDIAINDTTGSEDNSWCGDGHIIRIAPNASGSSSMFVGNDGDSVDNYLLVDEIPQDGDTTFVVGENVGDYDLYNFADSGLPAQQIIKRVWIEGTAKDPDAGNVSMLIQSGSTLAEDDADQQLSTSYGRVKSDEYTVNPNTGEAWTEEELNAIQAGMKIKS